jgi:hypothetical protein
MRIGFGTASRNCFAPGPVERAAARTPSRVEAEVIILPLGNDAFPLDAQRISEEFVKRVGRRGMCPA